MNKVYKALLIVCLITTSLFSFGQTQYITVVKLKNGSSIVECKKVTLGDGVIIKSNSETDAGKYWITAATNLSLQNSLKKAASWAKLNKEHKMEFEKEIVRVRVTDKDTYEFYKRYISEFTKEAKLIFQGHDDGSFTLKLFVTEDALDISLETIDGINDFIKLLQGKSANKGVDEIFH